MANELACEDKSYFFDIFPNEKLYFPNEKCRKKSFLVSKKVNFPYETRFFRSIFIQKIHEFSTIRHTLLFAFSPIEISVSPMKNALFSSFLQWN